MTTVKKGKKNIKAQIMFGYRLIILVPVLMTIVTVLYANGIVTQVNTLGRTNYNQVSTKEAIIGHYAWINQFSDSIMEGTEFTGSLDPNGCALGKWMAGITEAERADPAISAALKALDEPHHYIHTQASAILQVAKTDHDGAYSLYHNEIVPRISEIINQITVMSSRYTQLADIAESKLGSMVVTLIVVALLLAFAGVVAAVIIGNVLAKRISRPVVEIANWARNMSLGDTTYDTTALRAMEVDPDNEIAQMIGAFSKMADSVQNNVVVVKRVADGDLTAYVDIRSNMDVLGQSLYRMVQSNDIMFANIFDIASNVAACANEISKSSASVAQNTSEQAASLSDISGAVSVINELSGKNAQYVSDVLESFNRISEEVNESCRQMDTLVTAVEDIRLASDKISQIIKAIDDIAFQTNILALNAAIEAARAGVAGKGFAVVADEVRQLALKSTEAAQSTKVLIDNTISKTHHGARIAADTNATFAKITGKITETFSVVDHIAEASAEQASSIALAERNLQSVADAQGYTAAFTEQSSAASDQMRMYAVMLHGEMKRFNLRHRETGKPYIPEEKKNDPDFVRIATENYQRALQRGEVAEHRLAVL